MVASHFVTRNYHSVYAAMSVSISIRFTWAFTRAEVWRNKLVERLNLVIHCMKVSLNLAFYKDIKQSCHPGKDYIDELKRLRCRALLMHCLWYVHLNIYLYHTWYSCHWVFSLVQSKLLCLISCNKRIKKYYSDNAETEKATHHILSFSKT